VSPVVLGKATRKEEGAGIGIGREGRRKECGVVRSLKGKRNQLATPFWTKFFTGKNYNYSEGNLVRYNHAKVNHAKKRRGRERDAPIKLGRGGSSDEGFISFWQRGGGGERLLRALKGRMIDQSDSNFWCLSLLEKGSFSFHVGGRETFSYQARSGRKGIP